MPTSSSTKPMMISPTGSAMSSLPLASVTPTIPSAMPRPISIDGRSLRSVMSLGSRRPHQRKQDHVADRRLPGEQHGEAIDADALARRRRHADLERAAVVLVVVHGLGGARGARGEL